MTARRRATAAGDGDAPPGGDTRLALVTAAAREFNRAGYHGTDSNRIARAAGFAPATFYKHFADKREVFLAAWTRWVDGEWSEVAAAMTGIADRDALAARLVDLTVRQHHCHRGLRASMHALAAVDPVVRRFHRAERRRQLAKLAALRAATGGSPRAPEDDALLLFTLERACDALAQGEARDLGLAKNALVAALRARMRAHLE